MRFSRSATSFSFAMALALSVPAGAAPIALSLSTDGYILDSNDVPLTQAGAALRFSVWTDPDSLLDASRAWPASGESACTTNVQNGYYAVVLDGSLSSGCGAGLNSTHLPASQPRYLQVSVNGTTLLPRLRIGAVPSAARALDADTVGGESAAALRDASKLTGVASPAVLGLGSTGLTTVGTITTGTWNGTPIADGYVAGAGVWNAKLAAVAHDGTLTGDGSNSNTLKVNVGSAAGSVAAGDDARFGRWSGGSTGLDASAGRTSLGLGSAAQANTSAFATAAQGVKADDALPRAGGTMTGTLAMNGNGVWNADGTLGIGTTSARSKLTVASADGLTRIGVNGGSTAFSYAGGFHNDLLIGSRLQTAGGASEAIFSTGYGTGERKIHFGTASSSDFSTATFVPKVTITDSGSVGLGTTAPAALLDVRGPARFQGVPVDDSFRYDDGTLFAPQAYFESGIFPWSGTAPSFVPVSSSVVPFGKVALSTGLTEFAAEFVPVIPGETLYGEIWALRESGSTGSAGALYFGVARYDKDRKPIASNLALDYFAANSVTVPQTSTWTRYSGTTTLPTSHTAFNGSDGGAVRYVRPYVIVNYAGGTIPTYWGGILLRRQTPLRDSGRVGFNGPIRLNTPQGTGSNIYTRHYVDFTNNVPKKLLGWDGNKLGTSRAALAFCWITGTSSSGTSTWMVKQRESSSATNSYVERIVSFGSTASNTPEIFVDAQSELSIRMFNHTSGYDIACTMIEQGF